MRLSVIPNKTPAPTVTRGTSPLRLPPLRPMPPPHCLNCGAEVPPADTFCGKCGQENEASAVSFGALLREAWEAFVQIDATLLRTLRHLLTRPGFLSAEYVRGRRASYLSPFKMYLAVSALFFVLWGFVVPFDRISDFQEEAAKPRPILLCDFAFAAVLPDFKIGKMDGENDAIAAFREFQPKFINFGSVYIPLTDLPETVSHYRRDQAALAATKRDAPVRHYLIERVIRFRNDPADSARNLFGTALPLLLLIQLPLFAVWMRLIYFRQKRLYVEHLVFLLHTHTFFFLLTGAVFAVDAATQSMGGTFALTGNDLAWLLLAVVVTGYNLFAYRRFYGQGWGKTLVKGWFLVHGYVFLLGFTVGFAAALSLMWTLLVPG